MNAEKADYTLKNNRMTVDFSEISWILYGHKLRPPCKNGTQIFADRRRKRFFAF
jgi:hypothetical protein